MNYCAEIELQCLVKEIVEEVCEKVFRRIRATPFELQGQNRHRESERRQAMRDARRRWRRQNHATQRLGQDEEFVYERRTGGPYEHMRRRRRNRNKRLGRPKRRYASGNRMSEEMVEEEVVNFPPERIEENEIEGYRYGDPVSTEVGLANNASPDYGSEVAIERDHWYYYTRDHDYANPSWEDLYY